jgi:hypothetical protein
MAVKQVLFQDFQVPPACHSDKRIALMETELVESYGQRKIKFVRKKSPSSTLTKA